MVSCIFWSFTFSVPIFYNGKYHCNFFLLTSMFLVGCVPGCLKICANVMSFLLMSLFHFQTPRDGVNRDLSETVPRLPGETRITGKGSVKLGFTA